jgi:exodeoxyribonuclease V beta subunit
MKSLEPWQMPLTGTSLIEASAGTGKTYTLTTLYLRLLVEQDLRPSEILVVTYTKAATAELRDRIRERIEEALAAAGKDVGGEDSSDHAIDPDPALRELAERAARCPGGDPLRRALIEFDEAAIFTIHGFCQRTLQENAFESGMPFDAQLVEHARPIEEALAHDLFRRLLVGEDESFVRWLVDGPGKRWGFEPGALHRNILARLGADEDMPLIPAVPPEAGLDVGPLEEASAHARQGWRASWQIRRERLLETLTNPNGMKKGQYKADAIEGQWFPAFDELARQIDRWAEDLSALASIDLPEKFEKLRPEVVASGARKGEDPIEDPILDLFGEVWEAREALEQVFKARALSLRHRFAGLARAEASRRRSERHLFFFDDLLSEMRRALRGAGGARLTSILRGRYRFALIDEFQDTDPVQYDVFRSVWHEGEVAHPRGLVLVGDPKQAIYSFRGADLFTYLNARQDAGDALYELDVNWRSDPGVIGAVNALFGGGAFPFLVPDVRFAAVRPRAPFQAEFDPGAGSGAGLRVLFADRAALEADEAKRLSVGVGRTRVLAGVATDLVRLFESDATLDERPVSPSDVAILCRKKREIRFVREALEQLGIPCVDRGEADVFETREAWELDCVLRAMLRPADPVTLRGALSTGAHGDGALALAALGDDAPELAQASERYAEYGRLWSQAGFGWAFAAWRRGEEVMPRLLGYRDGERRLTNWQHLAELLQRFASERQPSRAGLVAALESAIASEQGRVAFGGEASLLRLERDDEAVQLVTLHGSKGLEYPIVYLPFLWEGAEATRGTGNPPVRFHDAESGRRTLDLAGAPDNISVEKEESFAEEIRLLYVGLTRARNQCVVAWGAMDKAPGTPLARLLMGSDADGLDRKAIQKELKDWTDADWRGAWERIGKGDAPCVTVESIDFEERGPWRPPSEVPRILRDPPARRVFGEGSRTTSFSALTREGHVVRTPVVGPEALGRDLDLDLDLGGFAYAEGADAEADLAGEMHAFPRGAEAGTLLHTALESVDFSAYTPEDAEAAQERRRTCARLLDQHGMESSQLARVLHVIDAVAMTPLRTTPSSFRLADLRAGALRSEMEFTLSTPGGAFDPDSLAAALALAPAGSPLAAYAPRAACLGFRKLNGYLRGFIDAVFHDGERYYLIDYKSNHLGNRQVDYAPPALLEPMIDHDYVLQYLIYTIAVDRHLSACVPDYDYTRDFGGAYYLFLRGFAAEHVPGCGVFGDRPPYEVVSAVADLLGLDEGAA